MADADLDVVIRLLAKQQNKGLMAAAKGRRDRYLSLAAKAKDKEAKERYKQIAKNTMLQGAAAANRLQISADNAADSYARSMRNAVEAHPAKRRSRRQGHDRSALRHERSFHNHALCGLLEPALRDFYEAPGAPRQIPSGSDSRVQIAD